MSGVETTGIDELQLFVENSTLTDADLKKSLNKALTPAYEKIKDLTPLRTGMLKSGFKKSIKNEGLSVVGTIRSSKWHDFFTEYGTSYDQSHKGWFERAVQTTNDGVIKTLSEVVLKYD